MTTKARWLASGVGGSATLAVILHPTLLVPVLVVSAVLTTGVPILLVTTLGFVAALSHDSTRRHAAYKIINLLLTAPDPRQAQYDKKQRYM